MRWASVWGISGKQAGECETAPAIKRAGAIQDHQAGYLRRAFRSSVSLITASNPGQDVATAIEVITFRAKAARGQLALTPVGPALMLHCQRLMRLHVPDDLIDLSTIQHVV